jgi:hypothetical protein
MRRRWVHFMDGRPTSDVCAAPPEARAAAAPVAARFWRGVFSESDGSPSFSRIATAVVVAFAVGWTSELVRLNHALPDFGGMTCFVGTLYGVNKLSAALGRDR